LPDAFIPFEQIVIRCVTVYEDSTSTIFGSLASNQADPKDASILGAALGAGARFLVTFNVKDYWPKPDTPITVRRPADLLHRIRSALSRLDT
jgi:hypothetical protein